MCVQSPRSRVVVVGRCIIQSSPSGKFGAIPLPPSHPAIEAMLGVPNVETLLPARLVEDGDA